MWSRNSAGGASANGAAQAPAVAAWSAADEERYRMADPYSGEGTRRRRRDRLPRAVAGAVAAALLCALVAWGAWTQLRPPDISAYADVPIAVSGLAEEDFTVTARELSEMDCESQAVTGQGQAVAGEDNTVSVSAYGPTLATFLAAYGAAPADFGRAVVRCTDGYTVVLTADMLADPDIILSIAQGKEPLDPWQRPMRLVVPSEQSGNWAYGVESIQFDR